VVQHRSDDPANPIRVLNLSYGSGGTPAYWTDPLQFAVEQAWKAGIVVVAASGNQGNNSGKLSNPATSQWVLAVGSTTTNGTVAPADDTVAPYSNIDPQRYTDVLAPGDSVASLRVPGSNIDNMYPSARVGDALFKGSGTSQAAAIASAAAALLMEYQPRLSADQVKHYLIEGKTWLPKGIDGMGEVNVNGAIGKLLEQPYLNSQSWMWGSGKGPIEATRGTSHVYLDGTPLTGENSVFGVFDSAAWAARSATHSTWTGGVWMGHRFAGDGWTGTSWATQTWADTSWSDRPWSGPETWSDPGWIGRYWSGRWPTDPWIGRYWSSDTWPAAFWG
jgi:serine protease AprX